MEKDKLAELLAQCKKNTQFIMQEFAKIIVGQKSVISQILATIFAKGHCLLVGVPGLAKTLMVNTLSQILALSFKRIQFTPDLMPSDITGTNVIEETDTGKRDFRFISGPLFAHIILADEINRTPPKTQAALLEAMQEHQVTVGQNTYELPQPFFVIATQNPIEQEGTYPLPEAQLDRFMLNIYLDYPAFNEEELILAETTKGERDALKPILSGRDIMNIQRIVESIPTPDYVIKYVAQIIRATRPNDPSAPDFIKEMVDWGAGPRAGQHLILAAKAIAAMDGRYYVSVGDVRSICVPVLRHRVATNFRAQAEGVDSVEIVKRIMSLIPEPTVTKYVE